MYEIAIEQPMSEVTLVSEYKYITNPRDPEIVSQYGLGELVVGGYNVAGMDAVEEQLNIEYGEATDVILALDKDGKALGSLAFRRLEAGENPAVDAFIIKVKNAFPEKKGRPILHGDGIVVDPSRRVEGIGIGMMRQAIAIIKPQLIVGETKTPEAVAVCKKSGTAYYGYEPVGDAPAPDTTMRNIIAGYVDVNKELLGDIWLGTAPDHDKNGIFFVKKEYLPTDVPRPNADMRGIFKKVCELQEKENAEGTGKTAVAPIITIIE